MNSSDRAEIFASFSPRQRILAAALKLFVEQGYFNTNVPDLSRESKCSVGSIYHSFKNKEEVARALYEEGLAAFRNALYDSLKDQKTPEDLVKTLVKTLLSFSHVNKQLSKYLWLCRHNEFLSGIVMHPTQIGFDRLGRNVAKSIKKAMREDQIKIKNTEILWSIIFGIPTSYIRDWLDGFNQVPPNEVEEELAEIVWQAIKN